MRTFLALGATALLLSACAPPGRGLLGPSQQKPSVATVDLTQAEFGRVPLVTIPAGVTPSDYDTALAGAVRAAVARKPDVAFDIVATVPQTGTVLDQISAAEGLSPEAQAVAQAIEGVGVGADRMTLGAMMLPDLPGREIRIYVR